MFTLINFVGCLFTGYVGTTLDNLRRNKEHGSSKSIFLPLEIEFLNIDAKAAGVCELMILKLINVLNCNNNDKNGYGYFFDTLNDYEHIYFAFFVLLEAHKFIREYYNNNSFESNPKNFILDQSLIVSSQSSSHSYDLSTHTSISELKLGQTVNLFGHFKSLWRDSSNKNYNNGDFYDTNGDYILVRY